MPTAPTAEPGTPSAGTHSAKVTITVVGTDYVILELLPGPDNTWAEFARETARTDHAAIKQALEGNTDGGTYVAIPARSFKPVKVTPHTSTVLKLEEAK